MRLTDRGAFSCSLHVSFDGKCLPAWTGHQKHSEASALYSFCSSSPVVRPPPLPLFSCIPVDATRSPLASPSPSVAPSHLSHQPHDGSGRVCRHCPLPRRRRTCGGAWLARSPRLYCPFRHGFCLCCFVYSDVECSAGCLWASWLHPAPFLEAAAGVDHYDYMQNAL